MKRKVQAPLPASGTVAAFNCILFDFVFYLWLYMIVVAGRDFAVLRERSGCELGTKARLILFSFPMSKTMVSRMKRILALTFSTLFMAGAVSMPVLAKEVPSHGGGSGQTLPRSEKVPNTGGLSPDRDTTGSISRDDAMSTLLSAIADAHSSATALSAMRRVAKLRVVPVRDIAKGDDARTIANAVKDNAQDRKTLQSAVRSNPALSARLKAKKADPSQIVAAKIEADGSVTVFTD